jgi:hypothetical protein
MPIICHRRVHAFFKVFFNVTRSGSQDKTIMVKCKTLSEKQTESKNKRAGNVVQAVEHLPSKHWALSSIPMTAKRKKKEKKAELLAQDSKLVHKIPSQSNLKASFLSSFSMASPSVFKTGSPSCSPPSILSTMASPRVAANSGF